MRKYMTLTVLVAFLLLFQFSAYAEDAVIPVDFHSVTDTEATEYVSININKVYSGRGEEENLTAAAIDENGSLWMWGDNSYEKCLGDEEYLSEPKKVMENVKQVAIGESHVAVLQNDGSLWTWGNNEHGQLGNGEISISGEPSLIMSDVKKISAGLNFTLALKNNGELYGFGRDRGNAYSIYGENRYLQPKLILSGIKDMSAGDEWSFVINNNDYLYALGYNYHGQLGSGTYQQIKRHLKIMENVKSVSAGSDCTLIVTKTGDLYGCGKNFYGQLGNELLGTTIPTKIMGSVKDAYCGEYFSLILKDDGTLSKLGGKDEGFINKSTSELSVLESGIYGISETGLPLALDTKGKVIFIGEDNLSFVDIKTPVEKVTEIKYIFHENGTITAYISGEKEIESGVGVLAYYKGNKLTGVTLQNDMSAGDAITFTPPVDSDCCRIFLFENLTTNKPLAEHKELNLSSNINMKADAEAAEVDGYDLTYNITVSISLNSLEFSEKPLTLVMLPDNAQETDLYNAIYIYQGVMEKDGSMELTFPIHRDFANTKIRASAGGVYLGECYVFDGNAKNEN